jgi:hypothetical protein
MSQTQEVTIKIEAAEKMECSICLDCIDGTKNQVVTECGHCFHASCLMKNVSHNGFGCPYCRTTMAEEQAKDEDEESEYSDYTDIFEEDVYDDYSLRGMRWMFQRAEGEELDEEEDDAIEEAAPVVRNLPEREEGEVEEDSEDEEETPQAIPTAEFIAYRLERGRVTMDMLVKAMLALDHDEYGDNREYNEMESNIFGRLRTIISNYRPEQQGEMQRDLAGRRLRELSQQQQQQQQPQRQQVNQLGVFGRGAREA